MAACDQTNIMALYVRVGSCGLSLAVDTGATVHVLSEESFKASRRNILSGRWLLPWSELNLLGATGSTLKILEMVTLPKQMKKGIPIKQMDFYVASNFQRPADRLPGLTDMKSNHIGTLPVNYSLIIQGKNTSGDE